MTLFNTTVLKLSNTGVLTGFITIVLNDCIVKTPLDKAIDICETQQALGEKFGKGQSIVSFWRIRCNGLVSSDYVLKVAEATEWQVTPHELRPDLYPHPDDGLPEAYRKRLAA
jgi:DNA-binding transcriptional regulator YdaS (Cro superfamily)